MYYLPGITATVFRALSTLKVRSADRLPKSTNSVIYLCKAEKRGLSDTNPFIINHKTFIIKIFNHKTVFKLIFLLVITSVFIFCPFVLVHLIYVFVSLVLF